MTAGNLLVIYGLFLGCLAAVTLTYSLLRAHASRPGRRKDVDVANLRLNLSVLWFSIICEAAGVGIPKLRSAWVTPTATWLVLTALVCLLSWSVYIALTPIGQETMETVRRWLGRSKWRDTSGVPGEIARKLQKKTKLARLPNETDSDYINRCREHIVRKLTGGDR